MENDFYATIKLKTGEEIFTRIAVTDEEENSLLIHSPVKIAEIKHKSGKVGGYKLESWIKTAAVWNSNFEMRYNVPVYI